MAELVDALVSNTSGATHPGSSPGLGTKIPCERMFAGDLFLGPVAKEIKRGCAHHECILSLFTTN